MYSSNPILNAAFPWFLLIIIIGFLIKFVLPEIIDVVIILIRKGLNKINKRRK